MVKTKQAYNIEKGIPIPRIREHGAKSKYRLDEMAIGDSILIPRILRPSVTSTWVRYAPKRFTSKIDDADQNMVRVWRVK